MTVRFCKRFAILAVLAGAALAAGPSPAHAAFTLTLHETGFADQIVTDNNISSGDVDSRGGVITFSGTFGTFNIQISVGTSNSASGVQPGQLTINNTSITTTSGGALTVTLADTGFTAPGTGNAFLDTQLSTTQLPTGSTVTSHSAVNGTAGGNVTLNTVSGGLREDIVLVGTNPFTLSNVTAFNMAGAGTLQFTGITTVTAVPEPGTMAMAFSALPLLGLGYWRHRRRGQAA